ncbi:MAG: hypothetical protein MUE91_10110 [Ignavibacteriaceae bacterium]|jgi:hypothetical protein|nr:hypothetical protein [Ignavibacteriaceae bacterium]MCU0414736.1 hypothetical protein [Ignavibacteriaceae bacterium]
MKLRSGILQLIPILLFFFCITASAQSIYFCEGVDEEGYPISESSSFTISSSGGYLYVLVRLPYEVDCKSVRFEIYRNGEYDNTVYVDTEYDWVWFWKQITFYKRGTYTFYIYDCNDYELVNGKVKINYD